MKKILTLVAALTLVASFSSVSWAIPFTQDTGFDTSATLLSTDAGSNTNDIKWFTFIADEPQPDVPVTHSVFYPTDGDDFNTIYWGASNDAGGLTDGDVDNDGLADFGEDAFGANPPSFSALQVLGFTGDAPVNTWTTISRLYHQNSTIADQFFTLQSAFIHSVLTVGTQDEESVEFFFLETLNIDDGCLSPNPDVLACQDKFSFDSLVFTPVFFTFGGQKYLAEFQFANLVDAQLDVTGFPTLALWTEEGVTSRVDVQMRLTQVVPEPASMMLLGSGLLGMVGLRRRKS